jgi:hypothetical protein
MKENHGGKLCDWTVLEIEGEEERLKNGSLCVHVGPNDLVCERARIYTLRELVYIHLER